MYTCSFYGVLRTLPTSNLTKNDNPDAIAIVPGGLVRGVVVLRITSIFTDVGQNIKWFIQTSYDEGVTWCDLACVLASETVNPFTRVLYFSATSASSIVSPSDGNLTQDTILNTLPLGPLMRVKTVLTGSTITYKYDCKVYAYN